MVCVGRRSCSTRVCRWLRPTRSDDPRARGSLPCDRTHRDDLLARRPPLPRASPVAARSRTITHDRTVAPRPHPKFSATGYVGRDVDDVVRELVSAAGGDVSLAEHGIVVIDEVDKLCAPADGGGGGGRGAVNTRDVQTGLLRLLEVKEASGEGGVAKGLDGHSLGSTPLDSSPLSAHFYDPRYDWGGKGIVTATPQLRDVLEVGSN